MSGDFFYLFDLNTCSEILFVCSLNKVNVKYFYYLENKRQFYWSWRGSLGFLSS